MSEKPDALDAPARELFNAARDLYRNKRTLCLENVIAILQAYFPDVPRVLDWLRSSPRKPAHLAFTAGPDRELATELEWELRYAQYAGCEDDAVAKEFCEWLSDRLPYTVFPSTEAVQLDVKEALIRILRKHCQPPASEPSGIDLPDSEGVWVDKHGKKWWVECTRVLREPVSALRLEAPLREGKVISVSRLERGGWRKLTTWAENARDLEDAERALRSYLLELPDAKEASEPAGSERPGAPSEVESLRAENHEAHAMLTGRYEIGWCMTHPDNVPDTELGKAAMEKNRETESLRAELAAAKARIEELESGSSCRPLAMNPLATGGVS